MPLTLLGEKTNTSLPVYLVSGGALEESGATSAACAWARANGFTGAEGAVLTIPGNEGALSGAFFGLGGGEPSPLVYGKLARKLPAGDWHFANPPKAPQLCVLALLLGGYAFTRYGAKATPDIRFAAPDGADVEAARRLAEGTFLARDLINTPANDMGPDALEEAARALAARHAAEISVTTGEALVENNFPMIYAVGRAGLVAPRLIDMRWGAESAPKVTLVGKGVCFDTGGLDIKPASSMLLMKKDMGGAANVLGLASMVMAGKLPVRLRVLIPAVENSISAGAFRPGDILKSRKGLTIEIGNTDAEGRLVLADALALADEEAPDLLIDMATLTGAARVALGPDVPPFYARDEELAAALSAASVQTADPLWRLPLWRPYAEKLRSKVADINNVTKDGFAGSVTAALFLERFVEKAARWAHFDIFGWSPDEKPTCPQGGEAQGIRAIEAVLRQRYGA
ncbi:leucyl aminopeptidase family protein [Chelativorans sp. SCAU2101]|uniref:Leucyl aminopeptidase family protein n=1 Tax=Chelativorans petroleitrophicus TaxID=2975484 RepID=A0A9X2X9G7_9HYPH|nr:leucyl aminopeptidase family protein [Chelativorans petroleitrophicus]MCT8990077.1 leucyl aminopeptidase family protein [Chelativorans petroleitrophicus]